MLSFDLRLLGTTAVRVDATLPAEDPIWEDADVRPVRGVHVTGRLSAGGAGRYFWSGHLEGEAAGTCRRCLVEVRTPVAEDVQVLFAESDLDEAEEADVHPVPAGARELDLRGAVREEWLLAAPSFVTCRTDCRGLCPRCGADLNAGACACAPSADPRWAALRAVRDGQP